MSFASNLRFLRKKNNHSQQDLASLLNYKSFTTIQKWEDGTSIPPFSVISKIANIYHTSVEQIMSNEMEISSTINVPILGTVRGGAPIYANQEHLGYEEVLTTEHPNDDYFYLKVVGDSMKNARILPGDILYVHRQNYLNNNEIGIILLDNEEATVKRVIYQNDLMILQPENDDYLPITLTKQDMINRNVTILGKVIHNKIRY